MRTSATKSTEDRGSGLLANLRGALKSRKNDLGAETRLVAEINQAAIGMGTIERRKLRAILGSGRKPVTKSQGALRKREELSLRLSDIEVLHAYLLKRGYGGFGSLLIRPTLVRSVADRRQVAFMLPSKGLSATTAVIHWDLRAMIEVLRALEAVDPTISIVIEDVPLREGGDTLREESFRRESWFGLLTGARAPSIICIGSPRANHAAELLLARMFEVEPFSRATDTRSLPFRFFWEDEVKPSTFTAKKNELRGYLTKIEKYMWGKCSALVVREMDGAERCFVIDRERKSREWSTYGVIAAQRREHGQIWVVAAGLEGPASLAAARELARLDTFLPDTPDNRPSRVTAYFFEYPVFMKQGTGAKQDTRELGKSVARFDQLT